MLLDNYEYHTDSLIYYNIEDKVCAGLGIGGVQSSNLPRVLQCGVYYSAVISAESGTVTCRISAYKDDDGYTVNVRNITVSRRHR